MNIIAKVTLTIEVNVRGDQWNGNTPTEQLHREGSEMAIKQVSDRIERYARIVGKPTVEAIITSSKVR